MMSWRNAHGIAMVAAARAHRVLEIDTSRPIDVFEAVIETGVVLNFQPLRRLSGAYLPGETPGIIVNAYHPLARQRFTAAHELGHYVLGHAPSVDPDVAPFDESGTRVWSDEEKQAEAFASWFLMPRRLIRGYLERLGLERPQSAEDVYALALRTGTSYEAMTRHLENLKLASDADLATWKGQQLRAVKLELAVTAPPSLRNDVWHLDERDNDQEIAVRAGDRLVIDLADTPSSGYSWDIVELPEMFDLMADSFKDPTADPAHELDTDDAEDPVVGKTLRRAFILDVRADAPSDAAHLALRCWQPWSQELIDEYALTIDVQPPRRGIAEEQLRIAA